MSYRQFTEFISRFVLYQHGKKLIVMVIKLTVSVCGLTGLSGCLSDYEL